MKRFLKVFLLLAFLVAPACARSISKSAELFTELQDGVVTIFSSTSHGSGFLLHIDPESKLGLVVTNNHVTDGMENSELHVKFSQDNVIGGVKLLNDPDKDLSVLLVNLTNIGKYKALHLYNLKSPEPLAIVGEEVLAIGNPIEWETLEKVMTKGVVSKFSNDIITHDVNINPGNSGGPLFNTDGDVIGVNTFITRSRSGPGIYSAVSVKFVAENLEKAKIKLKDLANDQRPSAELLPDFPAKSFPAEEITKAKIKQQEELKEIGKVNTIIKKKNNKIIISTFELVINTPMSMYREKLEAEKKKLKRIEREVSGVESEKSHNKKKKTDISNLASEAYYDYHKPIVQFVIKPIPQTTSRSNAKNAAKMGLLGFGVLTTALTGVQSVPHVIWSDEKIVVEDFKLLTIKSSAPINKYCVPLGGSKYLDQADEEFYTYNTHHEFKDSFYIGVYEMHPKCFENPNLEITIKTRAGKTYSKKLPEALRLRIVEEFRPYWELYTEEKINESVN